MHKGGPEKWVLKQSFGSCLGSWFNIIFKIIILNKYLILVI